MDVEWPSDDFGDADPASPEFDAQLPSGGFDDPFADTDAEWAEPGTGDELEAWLDSTGDVVDAGDWEADPGADARLAALLSDPQPPLGGFASPEELVARAVDARLYGDGAAGAPPSAR